ncbi:TIGR03943 family protein [Brevibacillus nitrificans]|uniref:TIGR03943 family protein n=1 Tax=Brevibacillus nitrificans TaxID=651560 RepID=A0A3M8DQK3_9BACL|nr:TIGR03943 family protein [Brevibacillus nitrificans]RNB89287.1 TIGR03943 family protein [Brevibacillus nitrificans]
MNQAAVKRHYFLRSLILIGFTLLLAQLVATDRLNHYLAPRLHVFSYVTLAILILLTLVSLRQAYLGVNAYECDCEDAHKLPRTWWRSALVYGMFALPLVMGFLMPDQILGSDVAEKRGITLLSNDVRKLAEVMGSGNTAAKNETAVPPAVSEPQLKAQLPANKEADQAPSSVGDTPVNAPKLTDDQIRQKFSNTGFGDFYTDLAVALYKQPVIQLNDKVFLDGLTTMELYAKDFAGKEIETFGFVYRQPDFTSQQFVVARFSVTCCTADASVFGVLVEDEQASKWAKDSWVKVRGKLEARSVDGYDMLVLRANKVEQAKAPKDPYVYYNYDLPESNG